MDRREFLWAGGAGAALAVGLGGCTPQTAAEPAAESAVPAAPEKAEELSADVVIVGGGLGGCAAALAAVREGATVILTEETDWLGGQLTAQAVPPDEHKYIEKFGCTRDYRRLRDGLRDYYRNRPHPALTASAKRNPLLNPGNGWVSRVCAEPRAGLAVVEGMLEPHVRSGRVRVLRNWAATGADVDRDRVRAV